MDKQTYYVTTPIYYVNDKPHIGHIYTSLAADVLARFYRLDGRQVRFLTGTDEHGQKISKAAKDHGEKEQEFCDRISQEFRNMSDYMNFSNDVFLRTTEARHETLVQQLWQKLVEKGAIYKGTYSGWYSISEECFYNDSELHTNKEGEKLTPQGNSVEWLEQESYFFKLSNWQESLLDYFEKNPKLVRPMSRYNETVSFISNGINDISISRFNAEWGVPVPGDNNHRIYVWFDALISYLTGADYGEQGSPFWPPNVQLLGKDILRFHTVYWLALLMALELPLPKRLFVHGWWTVEGKKMSKSLGNVIHPQTVIDKYGLDPIRYYLLRDFAFGNDGDFADSKVKKCINSELANGIGNLVHRIISMTHRYTAGKVPELGEVKPQDEELLRDQHVFLSLMRGYMQEQDFFKIMSHLAFLVDKTNQYVNHNAPWNLKGERLATVIYVLLESLRCLAIYYQPFIPQTAERILELLGVTEQLCHFEFINDWIKAGAPISKSKPIFTRLE